MKNVLYINKFCTKNLALIVLQEVALVIISVIYIMKFTSLHVSFLSWFLPIINIIVIIMQASSIYLRESI